MKKTFLSRIVSIIAAILLMPTFVAAGFAVCAGVPAVTEFVSNMTSDFEKSPYGYPGLTEVALEVRDYTINDYGRRESGDTGATNALAEYIITKAREVSDYDSPLSGRWSPKARSVLAERSPSYDVMMSSLADVNEQYALTGDAVAHLNDVNKVVSRAVGTMLFIAVIAIVCLVIGGGCFGRKCLAWSFLYAGYFTLAVLLAIEIWSAISFDSLFSVFHSLFFADGTWTFSAHSLLIEMYPIDFWVDMASIWLVSSCLVALISIIIGIVIVRSYKKHEATVSAVTTSEEQAVAAQSEANAS